VIDTASNKVTKTIPIPTGPHGLVITPDNKWLYASSDGASTVSVIDTRSDQAEAIDTSTNQVVWQVSAPHPHNIAITPDGTTAYAACQLQGSESLAIIDLGLPDQDGLELLRSVRSSGSTAAGSIPVRSIRARMLWAPRSAGCSPDRPPPRLPTGVRTASTMKASVMTRRYGMLW